jgi:hypothetical protein
MIQSVRSINRNIGTLKQVDNRCDTNAWQAVDMYKHRTCVIEMQKAQITTVSGRHKEEDSGDTSHRQMANGTHVSLPSSDYQWTLLAYCYDTEKVLSASVCQSVCRFCKAKDTETAAQSIVPTYRFV